MASRGVFRVGQAKGSPVKLSFTLSGPFFERDPTKTFRQNKLAFMDRIARVAQADVQNRLTGSREAVHTSPYVLGRTVSLSGKHWRATARISVNTTGMDATTARATMAIAAGRHNPVTRTGRFIGVTLGAEGRTHAFRRGRTAILRAAKENVGKLVEGLN